MAAFDRVKSGFPGMDDIVDCIRMGDNLKQFDICYVHPLVEHRWGQRVVRFYDPDKHIIEVGEKLDTVILRFMEQGLSAEEIAIRMDIPLDFVTACLDKR